MSPRRYLIVNADDFGLSAGVNRGISEAHDRGIVTSASLMVRWPAAPEAAAYGKARPGLSLGLHVDLGEWAYCGGNWAPLYEVVAMDDPAAVADEISNQLSEFEHLVGRMPTHLDSHQHVHLREPVRSVMIKLSRELGIPLRHLSSAVRYCGDFYGQTADGAALPDAIGVDRLLAILGLLEEAVTELACHPGEVDDLRTMYRTERSREIVTLCDPRVSSTVEALGIELRTFAEMPARTADGRTLSPTEERAFNSG